MEEISEYDISKCPKIPLTELVDYIVDNRGKTVPTANEGIKLIATNCIRNEYLYPLYEKVRYVSQQIYDTWFRSHPKPGDIIFVNKGGPGKTALVPKNLDFCIAQDMMAFHVKSDVIYNKYLLAVLRSREIQQFILNNQVGTIIPHFKKEQLKSLLIPVPDMTVQKRIGDFYFNLSEKCENNRKINENLEAQAQALFKSWFVDFEPFRDQPFVDSELGPIPQGWKVGKLKDIAAVTMGASPSGTSYNTDGLGDVFYQGRAEFGFRFPNRNKYTTEAIRFAEPNSVLLSVRAPVGDINVAEERCCIGRGLASVNSKDGKNSFLLYLMLSLKKHFKQYNAEGTVFGCINKDSLNNMPILLPNESIISAFESIASSFDNQIRTSEIEIKNLANLRDTLLPKLMSGEIKV